MTATSWIAIAAISMLASVVYEFTVISRFITEQKRIQDDRSSRYPAPE
jgi:hypothetical protein